MWGFLLFWISCQLDDVCRSQQAALESEEVGGEIVSDLGVQRETLERARTRLQETNAEISRSRKVQESGHKW